MKFNKQRIKYVSFQGWVPAYEEVSFNQKCFKKQDEWIPKLQRFKCVQSVGVVVGGWGIETDTEFTKLLSLDVQNNLNPSGNESHEIMNSQVLF